MQLPLLSKKRSKNMKKQVIIIAGLLTLSLSAAPKNVMPKKISVKPYKITIFNETGKNIKVEFMYAQNQEQAEKSMTFLAASSKKYRSMVVNFRIKKIVVKEGLKPSEQKIVTQKNVNLYKDTSLNILFSRGKYIIQPNFQSDWFGEY
jgi:hypothetical protein